jgi:hypothetical protein
MANFVYYLRNTDGCIKLLSNVIAIGPTGLLGGYKHEEQITGFPEPTVFWASSEGSTAAWHRSVLILSARQGEAKPAIAPFVGMPLLRPRRKQLVIDGNGEQPASLS